VELTEVAEIEALRDLFAAAPDDEVDELGIGVLELGEALAVRVRVASGAPEVNHALGITTARQLGSIVPFYGSTRHIVSPAPGVHLDGALRERGYEPGYAWMKFARELDSAPEASTELAVVEVGPEGREEFGRVAAEGSGMPRQFASWLAQLPGREGWHCFVAYAGLTPAATGALHVHEDLGWIGIGATLPAHRRRGAQSAILAARIRRAAELGCTLLVTETGEQVDERPSNSYRNILRAGFEPQYLRPNYAPNEIDPARASQVKTTGSSRPA
jgi:GNAT superfamily N-acetyltransferase